jgi:hypothetical protein
MLSPEDDVHFNAMGAASKGHASHIGTMRGILEKGYGTLNLYKLLHTLKKLDGDVEALAEDIARRRYKFERIIALLKVAAKFWECASYSSSRYSKTREQSGFSNSIPPT